MTAIRRSCLMVLPALLCMWAPAAGQDEGRPPAEAAPAATDGVGRAGVFEDLLDEISQLRQTVDRLRLELAEARMETSEAQRALDEMHQYIADHDAYGRDFEQYRAVKHLAEKESRRRQAQADRSRREADRTARREAIEARRSAQEAQVKRAERYREAGFTPLGFDVYLGQASFQYGGINAVPARVDYNGLTGRFIRLYYPTSQVDFSNMTVSGSVMSTSGEVRDIGIAMTFFDEAGNQVGGEIIQVNNARPDVPYPFTINVAMALDRPFTSSTAYVLYADPAGG